MLCDKISGEYIFHIARKKFAILHTIQHHILFSIGYRFFNILNSYNLFSSIRYI